MKTLFHKLAAFNLNHKKTSKHYVLPTTEKLHTLPSNVKVTELKTTYSKINIVMNSNIQKTH